MALTDDLVLYLDGEENSSDTEYYGVTGTAEGLSFDGTNDYATTSAFAPGSNDFSILFNITTTSTAKKYILAEGAAGDNQLLTIYMDNGRLYTALEGTGNQYSSTSTSVINDGEPHDIKFIYELSNDEIRVYIDGSLDTTFDTSAVTIGNFTLSSTLYIGAKYDGTTTFEGVLKEINLFDDITQTHSVYYNSGFGLTDKPALADVGTTTYSGAYKTEDGIYFDGSNDYATTPIGAMTSGTISFTTKFTDESINYNLFGQNSANFRGQYSASLDDVYFQVQGEGSFYSDENLDWTQEQHICFKWDGTNKYIYINGVLAGSVACTGSVSAGTLYWGHNSVNTNESFKGHIKNISLYDTDLSAEDITKLYEGTTITTDAIYYTSGIVQHDITSNGVTINAEGEYEFDGVNDYLESDNIQFGSNDFTFNFFFDWDGIQSDNETLFDIGGTHRVTLLVNSTGKLRYLLTGSSTNVDKTTTTDMPTTSKMFTLIKTSTEVKLYLENVLIDTSVTSLGDVNPTSSLFFSNYYLNGAQIGGVLKNFTVYDRALGSSELAQLYNNGGSPFVDASTGKLIFGIEMAKVNGIAFIKMNGV